ncbi:TonB-dependent receptor plug domain-containing protein [Aliikangiella sp. IMCC44632]
MLTKNRAIAIAVALVCLQNANVKAEEVDGFDELADFYGDEEFVSIATGSKKTIAKAPAVASVITASEIKAMGARNLAQVLESVPGLHVSRSGQLMAPEFWFRGITSTFNPQTLMMINGVSTKSSVRGDSHVVWGEFPIHAIERIEIIRGPGSALYGADAFSGVINIITKTGHSETSHSVGALLGSFNTKNIWANNQINVADWRFSSNFELMYSDGFDGIIDADAQTAIDNFAAGFNLPPVSKAPAKVAMQFKAIDWWGSAQNDYFSIDFGWMQRKDLGTGNGAAEVLDPHGKTSGYKKIFKLQQKKYALNEFLNLTTTLSHYASAQQVDEDFRLFPEGAFLGAFPNGFIGNPEWKEETTKAEMSFNYTGFDKTELMFGAGYERQNLYQVTEEKNFYADFSPRPNGLEDVSDTPEVFMPEADRESHFVYLQSVSQLYRDWELTAGARFDDYSDFGSTFNPRAALVWSTSSQLTSKLLYGRAFRATAFAELIVVNNPIALGNPNLKPETIDTLELAFAYQYSGDLSMDFNIYHYKIEDFITFMPDTNGVTATAQNVGKRSANGFEASSQYLVSNNLKLQANIAYVKATDDLANQTVGDYPEWQFYLKSDWKLNDHWKLNGQLIHVGERERTPGDIREPLSGYSLINLVATYQFTDTQTRLELLVNNLFNETVYEPSSASETFGQINIPNDLPQAGRGIYLKLSRVF